MCMCFPPPAERKRSKKNNITLMGFIFCFVGTDNSQNNHFHFRLGAFSQILREQQKRSEERNLKRSEAQREIHSIGNKGKYKNYLILKLQLNVRVRYLLQIYIQTLSLSRHGITQKLRFFPASQKQRERAVFCSNSYLNRKNPPSSAERDLPGKTYLWLSSLSLAFACVPCKKDINVHFIQSRSGGVCGRKVGKYIQKKNSE